MFGVLAFLSLGRLAAATEPATPPTVAVEVSQVRLRLSLTVGRLYQVEGSHVMEAWTPVGVAFIAEEAETHREVPTAGTGRFFRVVEVIGAAHLEVPAGFVRIPAGTFMMGSPLEELGRLSDEHQHQVTLTRGFWMCDHEVTQAEYQTVMGVNPTPEQFRRGPGFPVYSSWNEAMAYCQRLTQKERAAGRLPPGYLYRLPTEAEWEYACRAGTTTRFYWGAAMGAADEFVSFAHAWYNRSLEGTGQGGPQVVKGKLPNAWRLYDMSGNVSEMCSDWYGEHAMSPATDPAGPSDGPGKVVKGGNYGSWDRDIRSASRNRIYDLSTVGTGFRVVLSLQ